jgi:LysR family nitrogen assimilation transcriptional regulator
VPARFATLSEVNLDLRQLRYFVAIVEQGSFSRAAQVLNVAQPALSAHVRNMEADLGTNLLFRSAQGVMPTEAGTTLLRNARLVIEQVAAAEAEVRSARSWRCHSFSRRASDIRGSSCGSPRR